MNPNDYKKYHERRMMGNPGTSMEECGILVSAIPISIFLSLWLAPSISKTVIPIFEFLLIVLPVILNVTILSEINHLIVINLVVIYLIVFAAKVEPRFLQKCLRCNINEKKNVVSDFRACTNFVSAICILAVDFNVFPRRFAKTESFGFGFMDLGVGFFAFSHGLVEKHLVSRDQFIKVLKTTCIFLVLGTIRLLCVKLLHYHEHVGEYGVHWNFFFTLSCCRFLAYSMMFLSKNANPLHLAIIAGVVHQGLLFLGLEQWVLSDTPRDSFLSANKEGLTSCLGYVCIYFGASSIGKFTTFSHTSSYKDLLIKLNLICTTVWLCTIFAAKIIGISRKLANLGYIFWIMALSLTVIILLIIKDLSLLVVQKKEKKNNAVPVLLESINKNGLFFFLSSNLLTGLINFTFQTFLLTKMISMVIIVGYMSLLCGTTYFLYVRNILIRY